MLFLYCLLSFILVNLCFRYRFRSYSDMMSYAFGRRLGAIADGLLTFFLFAGNTIMLSGGGAMANEFFGIDKLWGIFAMAMLAFSAAFFSSKGIIAVNSIIVPFSMLCLILLGSLVFIAAFKEGNVALDLSTLPTKSEFSWTLPAILYASFNLIAATGVLCPLANNMSSRSQFLRGCILGSLVLTILAFSISYSILHYLPQSLRHEIPNLYIAKQFGKLLPPILSLVLWLEMLSTEVANLYSLSSSMQISLRLSNVKILMLILAASIPFSLIGFTKLITLLYPAYGVLGLSFICACIFKFLFREPRYKSD